MFSFNVDNVQELVADSFVYQVEKELGAAGSSGLKVLLNTVKLIYQQCPPEQLPGTLTVVRSLDASPLNPAIAAFGTPAPAVDYAELGRKLLTCPHDGHAVVEVSADNSLRLVSLANDLDLKSLAQGAIVYRFDTTAERILAGAYEGFVKPVSPLLLSNFAVPTFHTLEEAFRYYGRFIEETKCRILKDVWEGGVDGPRLVFVNKPEARMRDSLAQTLDLLLRNATVKPEQNTDETKPVDIRVNWFGSTAIALIEIKWLGMATAKVATADSEGTFTEYSASRAQTGAHQLADYLDREVRHADTLAPIGYLVVFDGRRKGVKDAQGPISEVDALAFEKAEIALNPDLASQRPDFAEPVRFFMRPRKSHFLAA